MTPISERENGQKNDNSDASSASVSSPPVPPRRKSQDKLKTENKENVDRNKSGFSESVIKVRWCYSHIAVDDNYYFYLNL